MNTASVLQQAGHGRLTRAQLSPAKRDLIDKAIAQLNDISTDGEICIWFRRNMDNNTRTCWCSVVHETVENVDDQGRTQYDITKADDPTVIEEAKCDALWDVKYTAGCWTSTAFSGMYLKDGRQIWTRRWAPMPGDDPLEPMMVLHLRRPMNPSTQHVESCVGRSYTGWTPQEYQEDSMARLSAKRAQRLLDQHKQDDDRTDKALK